MNRFRALCLVLIGSILSTHCTVQDGDDDSSAVYVTGGGGCDLGLAEAELPFTDDDSLDDDDSSDDRVDIKLYVKNVSTPGASEHDAGEVDVEHLALELCANESLTVYSLTPPISGDSDGDGVNGIAGNLDVASRYSSCRALYRDGIEAAGAYPVYATPAPEHLALGLQSREGATGIHLDADACETIVIICTRSNLPVLETGEAYAVRLDSEAQVNARLDDGTPLDANGIYLGEPTADAGREDTLVNTTPDTWIRFVPPTM